KLRAASSRSLPLPSSRTTEESASTVVARFVWRKTKLPPIVGLSFFSFPESASFVFFSFSSGQSLLLLHVPKENNVQRKRAKAFSKFVFATFRFGRAVSDEARFSGRLRRDTFGRVASWSVPWERCDWEGRTAIGAAVSTRLYH
ncbi:unnamed protein product, partial [Ixodes persulcatus]